MRSKVAFEGVKNLTYFLFIGYYCRRYALSTTRGGEAYSCLDYQREDAERYSSFASANRDKSLTHTVTGTDFDRFDKVPQMSHLSQKQ